MKKALTLLTVFVIILLSVFSPAASSSKLYCESLTVDNNRLFDVPICMKSDSVICAATFNLEYDSSSLAFRKADTEINNAKVKFRDSGKKVKLIFLSPNGVKLNGKSLLFTARFKPLSGGESKVKISASDCVNLKAKNISAPKSAYCTVKVSGKKGSSRGAKAYAYYGGKTGNSSSGSVKKHKDDIGIPYDEYVKSKDKDKTNEEEGGLISDINTVTGEKESPLLTIIIVIIAIAAALTIAFVQLRIKTDKKKSREKKKKEEDGK